MAGYLFFGMIVNVEGKIGGLLDDATSESKPRKFSILDLWHFSDLDYFAGEAFSPEGAELQRASADRTAHFPEHE